MGEGPRGVVIETPRLSLREFQEADAAALLELYREPSVARFLGPPPPTEADERANIRRHCVQYYRQRGFGLWAVELRDPRPTLVGRCGLLVSEIAGRSEVELSWVLAPEYRGRGFATEAARAVLDYANRALELDRIVAVIAPENLASMHVAERLGMQREGDVQYKTFGMVALYAWKGG